MEITNYQKTGTYDYNAWLGYINRDVLPRYINRDALPRYINRDALPRYINRDALPRYAYCNALPQPAYLREPMKYHDASVRREHKDLLFRLLMQDKENLLSVYNALNGTDYRDAGELEIVTLEDAVYMS